MTRDELLADFGEVRDEVDRYFAALPLEELFRQEGEAWAPIDDLRHLTRSLAAVTRGMAQPAEALVQRFGTPEGPTRSRREIGAVALAGLRSGGKATPELSPEPVAAPDRNEAYRTRCLAEWKEATEQYAAVLSTWPDDALDRYRFPHPFLGVFNLREWAHFNALHSLHHISVAERRLGRGGTHGE